MSVQAEKWEVDDEIHVGVFAIKSIAAGDELTYSYSFKYINNSTNEVSGDIFASLAKNYLIPIVGILIFLRYWLN